MVSKSSLKVVKENKEIVLVYLDPWFWCPTSFIVSFLHPKNFILLHQGKNLSKWIQLELIPINHSLVYKNFRSSLTDKPILYNLIYTKWFNNINV